MKNPFL
ncbi:hypothetical protein OIU78_023258, partial [Salix suchowensis]